MSNNLICFLSPQCSHFVAFLEGRTLTSRLLVNLFLLHSLSLTHSLTHSSSNQSRHIKLIMFSKSQASLLLFLFTVLGSTLKILWDFFEDRSPQSLDSQAQCAVYLAPSSIQAQGKGVFAGRDFNAREVFGPSTAVVHMNEEHIR